MTAPVFRRSGSGAGRVFSGRTMAGGRVALVDLATCGRTAARRPSGRTGSFDTQSHNLNDLMTALQGDVTNSMDDWQGHAAGGADDLGGRRGGQVPRRAGRPAAGMPSPRGRAVRPGHEPAGRG